MPGFVARLMAPELRAWRGRQPLWVVFWLYGVGVSTALMALYGAAIVTGDTVLRQILLLCFAPYTGWLLVAIWRCADNSSMQVWGLLARFLTVAWALNAALIVTFLELDLFQRLMLAR